ncbi:MAG: hypothetical protein A4E61_00631 [Syntrophorhabdus sp. PtaB.Bin184]|nr:MAG: hypothetical protein A4E61_00631 [Syntrophorhabdus sp. PtaB.Bin184]
MDIHDGILFEEEVFHPGDCPFMAFPEGFVGRGIVDYLYDKGVELGLEDLVVLKDGLKRRPQLREDTVPVMAEHGLVLHVLLVVRYEGLDERKI